MRTQHASAAGFTLIELLVVIAIIGILAGVILAGLSSARDKARLGAAMATMKSMQVAINQCLNEVAVTACMPGANTGGCNASVTGDTQDGGGGQVCPADPSTYAALPSGWVYCDTTGGTGACNTATNPTASQANSTTQSFNYILRAKRISDSMELQCRETGCTCLSGTGPACPVF